MTTNVLDLVVGEIATDSQWSAENDKYIVFVDDVELDKISIFDEDTAFMFAGDGNLIQEWKNKIADESIFDDELNYGNDDIVIEVCVVDMESKEILAVKGGESHGDIARFAGTGTYFAMPCWKQNSCAKTAVRTAIKNDKYSGGEVKYIEFDSRLNNIKNMKTISDVNREIHKRGTVMNRSNGTIIGKLNDGVIVNLENTTSANDAQSFIDDVVAGKIHVTAPSPSMYAPWTEDEKAELSSALKKIFAKKQAKRGKMALI